MTIKKWFYFYIFLITLCSCGFKPIYKADQSSNNQGYLQELAMIKVETPRSKIGYDFKKNLEKELNPNMLKTEARYLVFVELTKSVHSTFITSTGSSGRNEVVISANYKLKNLDSGEIIAKGTTDAKDVFNIKDKRFANYISEESITSNLTLIVAKNIRNLLINDMYQH